jgi:hypothetical protein
MVVLQFFCFLTRRQLRRFGKQYPEEKELQNCQFFDNLPDLIPHDFDYRWFCGLRQ